VEHIQTELDLHLARLKVLWPQLNFNIAELCSLDNLSKLALLDEANKKLNIKPLSMRSV
jgi:hypothetical protein